MKKPLCLLSHLHSTQNKIRDKVCYGPILGAYHYGGYRRLGPSCERCVGQ